MVKVGLEKALGALKGRGNGKEGGVISVLEKVHWRWGLGHIGSVEKVEEWGKNRALGDSGSRIEGTGVSIMDSDIGRAVGEEGSDQTDEVDRKGEGLKFE